MTKKNATTYVFLDTNVYLEFQDFDQIDWPKILGYQHVCLVLAPVTFTELERFKYGQKSERRQSRSRRIIKKLDQIVFSVGPNEEGAVPGRPGVTLTALTDSPTISAYPGLDNSIADDQLIASVLKFATEHPEIAPADILLVGDDAGCLNKVRARSIRVTRLDDQFRLPDEPSTTQKELAQLKRQLQELQAKQPQLRLAIPTHTGAVQEQATRMPLLSDPEPAVLDRLYAAEEQATEWYQPKIQLPRKSAAGESSLDSLQRSIQELAQTTVMAAGNTISQEEIERYQRDRDKYLQSFRQYVMHLYAWEERKHRSRKLVLSVLNEGTVPATGAIVRFVVPDGIAVFDEDDAPEPPRRLHRPQTPRTQMQEIMRTMSIPTIPGLSSTLYPSPSFDPDTAEPDITSIFILPASR